MITTKWVFTTVTEDGKTVHAESFEKESLERVIASLIEHFGPFTYSLSEKPATWLCDGSDGCENDA